MDIDALFEAFNESGLVAITGNKATENEQLEIAIAFGDRCNWIPNSNKKNFYTYKEDHSLTFLEKLKSEPCAEELLDERILVNWHLEHIHKRPMYVGAIWVMKTFNCSRFDGMTGFVDACELIDELKSDEVEFLKCCRIRYDENNLIYKSVQNTISYTELNHVPAIDIHRTNSKNILRLTPAFDGEHLVSFKNREPSVSEVATFSEIKNKICNLVWKNRNIQFWWTWEEGDLLIVDLSRMYHSVTGGFKIGQRELIGIHCTDNV